MISPASASSVDQLRYAGVLHDAQGPVHHFDEAVGQNSDEERGEAGQAQGGAHGIADGQLFFARLGLAHEHGVGNLEVVVESEDRVEHAERGQHVVAGRDQAEEDEVLAPESSERRNAGQGQHEDQHEDGFDGSARVEAVQVVELVADHLLVAQRSDHAESAEIHEGVNQQVDQDALDAVGAEFGGRAGDQAEQHVADMGDGGVGQQALGVGLRERGEIRAGHGGDGNENHNRNPHGPQVDQSAQMKWAANQDAQQHGPSGSLDGDGHESSDRGGRAFVGVGRPLVEGDGGDLEEKAGHGGEQRDHQNRFVLAPLQKIEQAIADVPEVGAAGQAVEQGQTVSEDAGGERPEQQIFQRGFIGAAVAAEESDEHVGGDGHQFQSDEDQHDVVASGHAHHADDGKQHQGVILAMIFIFDFEIAHRHQDGDRGSGQEQVEKINGEAVHQQGAHHALVARRITEPVLDVVHGLG